MKRLLLTLLIGFGSCFNPTFEEDGLQCNDGVDNDGDDLLDCEEDACADAPECNNSTCGNAIIEGQEECDNGSANSDNIPNACRTDCTRAGCGDDLIDSGEQCDGELIQQTCEDLGFTGGVLGCDSECQLDDIGCISEQEICDNLQDDDGDGRIDCQDDDCLGQDPICDLVEQCDNGQDDNFNQLVDCQDPECEGAAECVEDCGDGLDNDGDGFADCDDCADCQNSAFCKGGCFAENVCDDGFDDDDDGQTDCEDFDCVAFPDCAPVCGNGTREFGEQCDDGNTQNGDDCDAGCRLEDVVQESEINNDATTANLLGSPDGAAAGSVQGPDVDFFAVNLVAGTVISFETTGFAGFGACDGDTLLALFDTDGISERASDDDGSGVGNCSLINFTVTVSGTYFIAVSAFSQGDVPSYLLFLSDITPAQFCGNNIAESGESCDGDDLAGSTCDSATGGNLPGGNLSCNSDCTINTSACFGP